MFASLFFSRGDEEGAGVQDAQVVPPQQRQDGGALQLQEDDRLEEEGVPRAIWAAAPAASSASGDRAPQKSAAQSSSKEPPREPSQGPAQGPAQEGRRAKAKEKVTDTRLDTLSDALDFCRGLLLAQLERAREERPPMNEAISGDAHARKTVVTLLPDQFVRLLFLEVAKARDAWPRVRPLFGAPPYHFLRPEDAGLLRAGGIAAGRTNMSYDKTNESASYSQFGSGHLVDEYSREYRVVSFSEPKASDDLPCDVESIQPLKHILMNVRVPKRSRASRTELLKDASKRRAVLFPQVGETINVRYSSALRHIWRGADANFNSRVMIKSLAPRAASASTASLVAVKVV